MRRFDVRWRFGFSFIGNLSSGRHTATSVARWRRRQGQHCMTQPGRRRQFHYGSHLKRRALERLGTWTRQRRNSRPLRWRAACAGNTNGDVKIAHRFLTARSRTQPSEKNGPSISQGCTLFATADSFFYSAAIENADTQDCRQLATVERLRYPLCDSLAHAAKERSRAVLHKFKLPAHTHVMCRADQEPRRPLTIASGTSRKHGALPVDPRLFLLFSKVHINTSHTRYWKVKVSSGENYTISTHLASSNSSMSAVRATCCHSQSSIQTYSCCSCARKALHCLAAAIPSRSLKITDRSLTPKLFLRTEFYAQTHKYGLRTSVVHQSGNPRTIYVSSHYLKDVVEAKRFWRQGFRHVTCVVATLMFLFLLWRRR